MKTRVTKQRRTWVRLVVPLVGLACGNVMAGTIAGSAHDFSGEAWNNTNEVCVVCHTPHEADITVLAAPLWNHDLTTKNFAIYDSPTFDASDIGQPSASTKLCLSCHDGTVGVDSFGGRSGGDFLSGTEAVGRGTAGLSDDHPVSFTYDSALATADGALFDPSTATATIGSGTETKSGTLNEVMLLGGKVECASCHDVHNTFTVGDPLLKITRQNSDLCLTCHKR